MTDRIAEALLRTVIQYGPVCIKEPENYQARSEIMWAGSLSHNHLTGLGRDGDWATHQIEHELGGMYDVAHGAGLAAVWPSWARYVCPQDLLRFARFGANVWGIPLNYEHPEETGGRCDRADGAFLYLDWDARHPHRAAGPHTGGKGASGTGGQMHLLRRPQNRRTDEAGGTGNF